MTITTYGSNNAPPLVVKQVLVSFQALHWCFVLNI